MNTNNDKGATNVANDTPAALLPCPFCGGDAYFERTGTQRRSCIVSCTDCGARHESSDEGDRSGSSWNRRASTAPVASESRGSVPEREPSHDMIEAGARSIRCDLEVGRTPQHRTAQRAARNAWVTMRDVLAAAPTPPAVPNGEPPDWAIAQAFRESLPWSHEPDRMLVVLQHAKELARSAAAKGEG